MLDIHALNGTPGAATVLGSVFATIPANDGQASPGVPITPSGAPRLVCWGGLSPTADTIGNIIMQSQDQVDSLNGENIVTGAASLLNIVHEWTNLPFKSGARQLKMGTNTGVISAGVYTIDSYSGGPCVMGSRVLSNQITPAAQTYGGALTGSAWSSLAFAPANALPIGSYALLGARVSAITNAALIRFQHADFGAYLPGFPVANYETISTSTWDKIDKDDLLQGQYGNQFVYMSEITGQACVPVFRVTSAGTGLNIQMYDVQADTPVVTLCLAQVKAGA